ncbi:assimilatory nitrate reductase (NADH) beta subunit [Jatrophihabitans endophyticus]|uniref:Assimilatory nitrate reductase (NADH) beta subunit n=1 Tax=Jatrophihabitans endophyticus TaxID=1206085 RepID=A0A1M5T0U8_9ACTN|nr:FAD-dependent oxidoreductase [Jatrophihabitans endophyticus]SHH44411.1 assimilatory nitrate reductase (NADH) beta subunit [Jatrophihabitans endophyticus]
MSSLVVVGNGMAGARLVQELLARDPARDRDITVVGDEPGGAYNRMQLSNVLAGTTRSDAIDLAPPEWYAAHDVTLVAGRAVTGIDRAARRVHVGTGGRDGTAAALPYDDLVLATGSDAVLPPVAGLLTGDGLLPGVATFRTLADCVRIDELARTAGRAVVLGAGVLGLEAARGLAGRGLDVTLVQRGRRLMERQLDAEAARTLARSLAALGLTVSTGSGVAGVTGEDRLDGVVLGDGRRLPCDLLVLCCGVRPRVELATAAGLPTRRGVLVDDELRSVGDPHVRAIGECAEHEGTTYGLVAPCWEHARVVADLLADPACGTRYRGSAVVTRLKAAGLELATVGEAHAAGDADDDADLEVVRFSDTARGVYQKLVVRDGRLTGAILLGDTRTVGTVTQLYDRGALLPPDRSALLLPRRAGATEAVESPTALPATATVCQCNGVTKGAIVSAWQDGARTAADVAARTRATTGCGTCRDTVCGLVEWLAAADPDEPAPTRVLDRAG